MAATFKWNDTYQATYRSWAKLYKTHCWYSLTTGVDIQAITTPLYLPTAYPNLINIRSSIHFPYAITNLSITFHLPHATAVRQSLRRNNRNSQHLSLHTAETGSNSTMRMIRSHLFSFLPDWWKALNGNGPAHCILHDRGLAPVTAHSRDWSRDQDYFSSHPWFEHGSPGGLFFSAILFHAALSTGTGEKGSFQTEARGTILQCFW